MTHYIDFDYQQTIAGPVRQIRSNAEAIAIAKEVAAEIAAIAADPASNKTLPYRQAALISQSGLTAIYVPQQFGGLGADIPTVVEVVRIISAADGGVGQLLQIHNVMLRGVLNGYDEEVRQQVLTGILAGKRLGNALAEVGGKNKFAHATRVERQADGRLILNGSKFYSTGSFLAEWISLTAAGPDGPVGILLHRDTPGVSLVDDWDAFGQHNSVSGTVKFENVLVDERFIPKRQGLPGRTGLTWPQILHAAMDTGIAAGALQAGIDYLQQYARPWVESGVERAVEEQHIIKQVGEFAVLLRSAEALLEKAARFFELQLAEPDNEALQDELILSVAAARAQSDHASLKISSDIFALLGASSTLSKWNLDRFWRNARVHTTHDPIRWRLFHVGNYYLNGVPPGEYNSVFLKQQAAKVTQQAAGTASPASS